MQCNMRKKILACAVVFALMIASFTNCKANDPKEDDESAPYFYRAKMIDFISDLSSYARSKNSNFALITNNGLDLYQKDQVPDGYAQRLLDAVGGALIEGAQYNWDDNHDGGVATSKKTKKYIADDTAVLHANNKPVFSADYCGKDPQKAATAVKENAKNNIATFPARYKELTSLEYVNQENFTKNRDINTLNDVQTFAFLLNPDKFANKADYLNALKNSPTDLLIIDLYYDDKPLTPEDLSSLKIKADGHKRLVYSYMSIGEAENYRYYWQKSWSKKLPDWIIGKNDEWEGDYPVKYWSKEWQKIIYGTPDAYLDKILTAGFDGAFLDIVDGYENFE